MTKRCPLVLVPLFVSFYAYSQPADQPSAFDSAFYYIYMHTASTDPLRALQSTDSLYTEALDDTQRIRALMLTSEIYHRMANRDSSIYYAERAGKVAERARDYGWQARIYGVLSTQHRETGLLKQGRQYLTRGLRASERIVNPNLANQFKGNVYQEMGFYSFAEDDYKQSIAHFRQAESYFQQLQESPSKSVFMAQNEERLGASYLRLSELDSAHYHFSRALSFDNEIPQEQTPLKGLIYNGLGRVNLARGKREEAFGFLSQALEIAEATQFPNLKIGVYSSLTQYYEAVGDMDAYSAYNKMYLDAIENNASRHRDYADNVVIKTQTRLEEMTASLKNILFIIALFLLVAVIGISIYIKKQKQNYERFKQIIHRLRQEKQQSTGPVVQSGMEDRELMPEATRIDLLKKLERFETSSGFTDKNISIAVLAGKLKTNTKYLSHIINKYKQKDFNTYINALRIDYIVTKMGNDPKYLNYKISYLADECGFSTHSQFTNVFKQITGISPSIFITYLKKDHQKEEPMMVS